MKLSPKAKNIFDQLNTENTKLGYLSILAKDIKKDHELAMELWSTESYFARQLAILIMDKKLLSQEIINQLDKDINKHPEDEKLQLIDWLMANQLAIKTRKR